MNVAVFCASQIPADSRLVTAATDVGRGIAACGHRLIYGGSNLGLMGMVSKAAIEAGGSVTAIIPTFFGDEVINSQPGGDTILVSSMTERKERMIQMSDIFIALPGGIGTLDEISEVMVAHQLGLIEKRIVLLNICGFYDPLMAQLKHMREQHLFNTTGGLIAVDSVSELWRTF